MRTVLVFLLLTALPTRGLAAVPFTLEQGLITVDVHVGGATLPLMLDFGDFRAISLTSAVLDSVPVEFTGEVDHFVNFAGDPLEARRFVVADVALGPLRHATLGGSEDVYDANNPSPNPYGAIGRSFFDGHPVTIDYGAGVITFDESADAATCLPLDVREGMLRVKASIDGHEYVLLVDTGAQVSLIAPAHFAENATVYGGHSGYRAESIVIDGLELGGTDFVRMDIGAGGFDGILGQDVLSRYVVTIDVAEECLRLAAVD